MLRKRIIPILLLHDESIVKTKKFKNFTYIGDPVNTVRIFNELGVDELLFLDIKASKDKREPNLKILKEIANECFMPLGYGGGINSIKNAKEVFDIGFEKISINTNAIKNPNLISELARAFGSQSIIVSIDIKSNYFGKQKVFSFNGKFNKKYDPTQWAKKVEKLGAGEILITSIDKEGTWEGFDNELIKKVSNAVSIPVIANGGCGNVKHLETVISKSNASAAGIGSMVVFQKKDMGVLINFPNSNEIESIIS